MSHFAAGFAVGAATSTLGGHAELSASGSAVLGFGSAAAVAAGKETADLKVSEGCWSWKDFTWMLLGGAVGSTVGTAVSH